MARPALRPKERFLRSRGFAGAISMVLCVSGCAASSAAPDYDPMEKFNRGIFWFNDKADTYVLEPVARGWDWIAPRRVQTSVSNFFFNLRFPINAVNDVLQADARATATHVARFMVNTTIGVAGLFDPASDWGLRAQEEDFGQTLGRWGVGPGPYLVIPVLGPSTVRDVTRIPVDGFISGIGFTGYGTIFSAAFVLEAINFRAANLDTIRQAKEASIDYYSFLRSAYLQRRQALINDSTVIPGDQSEDLYDVEQYEDIPVQ